MIKLSQPVISEDTISRVGDILRSGCLVHGEECIAFERELSVYLGVKHVLLVSSGTAALHLSLLAHDIGPGDAVLVPDFTFVATANVVEFTGAKAVMVDVLPDTYNMDPEALQKTIVDWGHKEKIKAIMPVLEFGNPSAIDKYVEVSKRFGITLIEDAACALGAFEGEQKIGTFGDCSCFSFHPRKTLTTGEGGAIATGDSALAERISLLRSHGMSRSEDGLIFKSTGLNYRLTNFQAAIGRDTLNNLPSWLDKRFALARSYNKGLQNLAAKRLIRVPVINPGHSCQTYMIVLSETFSRADVIRRMRELGVEVNSGAQSMSSLGLYKHRHNYETNMQVGPHLAGKGLALPLHENMIESDAARVVDALEKALT